MKVAPFVDNLLLDAGGTGTTDDLVAGVERGLLLTCLWYIRELDPESLLLTGLTRDGVYLIENGEITGVVNNFRYNESPLDLLGRISGSSAPEQTLPREWSDFLPLDEDAGDQGARLPDELGQPRDLTRVGARTPTPTRATRPVSMIRVG